MNRRTFLGAGILAAFAPRTVWARDADGFVETHRLRVVNRAAGTVSVSTDAGATWQLIGRVLLPATSVTQGYIAAEYAAPGTVAATAVHGHRLRVSGDDASLRVPAIVSLAPKEYAGVAVNAGFGGHRAGGGGIYTNIPAGVSLFRELAPHVGCPVLREDANGKPVPLPASFVPNAASEVLVIVVRVPMDALIEVVFPNVAGGAVRGTFASGATRDLTQVVMPVRGVGRFDGTAYTGVGRLNTAHTGVITVSTAPVDGALPEGVGKERRGGFQISPAWHNSRCEEAGAPMVMTLGEVGVPRHRDREGQAPLFRDAVSLGDAATIVDVSVDGGDWEPMPTVTGLVLDAFTPTGLSRVFKAQSSRRAPKVGVTAFRLRLPYVSPERMVPLVAVGTAGYVAQARAAARRGEMAEVSGVIAVEAGAKPVPGAAWARLLVDNTPHGFTNVAPFTFSLDTRRMPDGEYLLQTETLDTNGATLQSTEKRVFVSNATRA